MSCCDTFLVFTAIAVVLTFVGRYRPEGDTSFLPRSVYAVRLARSGHQIAALAQPIENGRPFEPQHVELGMIALRRDLSKNFAGAFQLDDLNVDAGFRGERFGGTAGEVKCLVDNDFLGVSAARKHQRSTGKNRRKQASTRQNQARHESLRSGCGASLTTRLLQTNDGQLLTIDDVEA